MPGTLLVAAQFGLIGLILWLGRAPDPAPLPVLLVAAGVALGLWTLAHNRLGNFNIRPAPKTAARLVTTGPYRRVRHPMYVSLLLFMAGWIAATPSAAGWTALGALLVVLVVKARVEEKHLCARFADYPTYMQHTWRFAPGIW